jgi:hypothetical protein
LNSGSHAGQAGALPPAHVANFLKDMISYLLFGSIENCNQSGASFALLWFGLAPLAAVQLLLHDFIFCSCSQDFLHLLSSSLLVYTHFFLEHII